MTPNASQKVRKNQVFAWNPSINAEQAEDTSIVEEVGISMITEPEEGWPLWNIETTEQNIRRPRRAKVSAIQE